MKRISVVLCMLSLVGFGLLTACNEDGGSGGNGGGGNPNPDPDDTNGVAPARIGDKLMTVNISDGSPPFASDGVYSIAFGPSDANGSGNFTVNDSSNPPQPVSGGTYTYTRTDDTTALLLMEDHELGDVTSTLTFDSRTSGDIHTESTDGGFEDGTFVLE